MRGKTEGQVAEILGVIGFGSFLAVSLAVGTRLLLLARRTRRLPELAMGLNFLLAGFIGYALLVAAGLGAREAVELVRTARPGTIESPGQLEFVRGFKPES